MASKWTAKPLEEIATLSGGFAFRSGDYAPFGRFILRTLNIRDDGAISKDDAVFLPEELCTQYSKFELRQHDTLFVMVGATIGKVGYVRDSDLPALLNQNMWLIRALPGVADQRFVHYAFRHAAKSKIALAAGSARDFFKRDDFRKLLIPAPPLDEQYAIAKILGALDDKVELNRQMNRTLEAMAHALFKSWFVDFDPVSAKAAGRKPYGMSEETAALFPGGFEESAEGAIPRGWKLKPLDKIADYENGLALQNFRPTGDEYLPVIKIRELRQGFSSSDSEKASPHIRASSIIDDGDVIFSWSGSLLVEIWCGGRGALNQHLFKVTSAKFPKWFYYFWTKEHLEDFQDIASGKATTMGHIQRHHLSAAQVVVPADECLERADKLISPLIVDVINNRVQSRTLAALRDTLLPKLLSGEVRVRQAENLVAEAV